VKLLALVALVLALGLGVFFVLTGDGGGKRGSGRGAGTRDEAPEPRDAQPSTAPRTEPAAARRQEAEEGAPVGLRVRYEGTVVGEGAPLPGAEVAIWRLEQKLSEARSDERGRFRLEHPAQGSATTLRVQARGFVALERSLPPKGRGGTEMLGNVRLLRGQRLGGRVVDSRGSPIQGAEVRVEPGAPGSDLFFARGTSLADGTFEIADCPPGLVTVRARARGYGELSLTHTPGRPLELRMLPGVDLPLFVCDAQGHGVAEAEVTIQSVGGADAAQRTGLTDAEGRIRFEGLNARLWNVRVSHSGYRPAGGVRVNANGNEERVTVKPWPGIVGTVRTEEGAPPPTGTRVHALIALAPGDTLADLAGGTEVAADGSFRIPGLRPADWVVRVAAPGFAPATSSPVKLLDERDGSAGTIVLTSGGKLELLVRSGGKPLAEAEVEVLYQPPSDAQLWALRELRRGQGGAPRPRSDSDGRIVLQNLPGAEVWLALYADGHTPRSTGPHVAREKPTQPIELELARGGRAHGLVRRKSGAPDAHAQLRVVEHAGLLGFPLMLATDEQGRYTTSWLPPGRYTVEAFSSEDPALRSEPREFVLAPGAEPEVDLTL